MDVCSYRELHEWIADAADPFSEKSKLQPYKNDQVAITAIWSMAGCGWLGWPCAAIFLLYALADQGNLHGIPERLKVVQGLSKGTQKDPEVGPRTETGG